MGGRGGRGGHMVAGYRYNSGKPWYILYGAIISILKFANSYW